MKIIANIVCFWVSYLIVAGGQISGGGETAIVRPGPDWAEWSEESNSIVKFFKDNRKSPENSKVSLLFVGVLLGLNDPVAERGAALSEFACVYSEFKNEDGSSNRKITMMGRQPYLGRQWEAEWVNITEGKEPTGSVLTLDDKVDTYTQLLQYTRSLISDRGPKDFIIDMIVFEKNLIDVLGRNLTDAEVLDLTKRQAPEK